MKSAVIVASMLVMPLAFSVTQAQMTGVSRPDQTDITTSSDAPPKPSAYGATTPQNTAPASVAPALHARVVESPDGSGSAAARPARDGAFASRNSYAAAPAAGAASAPDMDGEIVTRLPGPSNQLPVGTLINTRIRETISTQTTAQGTMFTAALTDPVLRDGAVLLPAGSLVTGRVTEVHGGRRVSGPPAIHLQTLSVTLPDGTRYPLRGQVIDTGSYNHTKVDSEGTILRRDHAMATVSELGLATGAGAAAGGVIGGVPGALIGGAVGAGVGTTVWLKQDRQTQVPAQTVITFSLDQPLTVGAR